MCNGLWQVNKWKPNKADWNWQRDGEDTLISSIGLEKSLRARAEEAAQSIFVAVCLCPRFLSLDDSNEYWHWDIFLYCIHFFWNSLHVICLFPLPAHNMAFVSLLLRMNINKNKTIMLKLLSRLNAVKNAWLALVRLWIGSFTMPAVRKQHFGTWCKTAHCMK